MQVSESTSLPGQCGRGCRLHVVLCLPDVMKMALYKFTSCVSANHQHPLFFIQLSSCPPSLLPPVSSGPLWFHPQSLSGRPPTFEPLLPQAPPPGLSFSAAAVSKLYNSFQPFSLRSSQDSPITQSTQTHHRSKMCHRHLFNF